MFPLIMRIVAILSLLLLAACETESTQQSSSSSAPPTVPATPPFVDLAATAPATTVPRPATVAPTATTIPSSTTPVPASTVAPTATALAPTATAEPTSPPEPAPTEASVPPDLRQVSAVAETAPLNGANHDLDDPAVWVNPNNADQSVIVGTNKAGGNANAGLRTWNLDGSALQTIIGFYSNNVDLRTGFPLGGTERTVVTTCDRTTGNYRLLFFVMDEDPGSGTYRQLLNVSGSNLGLEYQPYGQALYHSAVDDKWYVFVSSRTAPGTIRMYELIEGDGADAGKIVFASTTPLRTISYRPSADGTGTAALGVVEGLVADDANGTLFAGDELYGLYQYGAEPTDDHTGTIIDRVTTEGGRIKFELEGVAIARLGGGAGRILVVGQNGTGRARVEVYDRQTYAHQLSFEVIQHSTISALDEVNGTDGIEVVTASLGANFPHGLIVVHDDQVSTNETTFKLVPYEDVFPEDAIGGQTVTPRFVVNTSAVHEPTVNDGAVSVDPHHQM